MKLKRREPVPENWTGGVDLSDAPDIVEPNPDSLVGLNRHPDVIQTLAASGRVNDLYPSTNVVGGNAADDPKDDEDPDVKRGLHEIATRYDGQPVRVVPASRMRTQRLRVTAGLQMSLAARDSRRVRTTVMFTSSTATDLAFISNDQTTAVAMGFVLPVNVPIELRNGDEIGLAVDATNVGVTQYVSIMQEIQE